jgi:hypothetical protein
MPIPKKTKKLQLINKPKPPDPPDEKEPELPQHHIPTMNEVLGRIEKEDKEN